MAAAQTLPLTREQQHRQVVVPGNPGEPVPEVRVVAGFATTLVFDAPIDRATVEVEGRATRFRLVDPGERTLFLDPLVAPGDGERLGVRVRYKDGAVPGYATVALVSHPTQVDTRVDVVRRQRTPEVLEVALAECEASGPIRLVMSGQLDRGGVQTRDFQGWVPSGNTSGLITGRGRTYRATRWVVVTVKVTNLPDQRSWAPGSARLLSAEGTVWRVRQVKLQGKSQLQPGESDFVVVEADAPTSGKSPFQLELLDSEGGRLFPIQGILFNEGRP